MASLRRFLVLYRLPIALVLIAIGVIITMQMKHGIWVSWIFFLIAILMVVAHFMIGPITLIQKHIEDGDFEGAQALLAKVKYPNLLYTSQSELMWLFVLVSTIALSASAPSKPLNPL